MLSITDGGSLSRALDLPLDPSLKRLLLERRNQLGDNQAHFVIIQAGDTPATIHTALGFSPCENLVDQSRYGEPDFTPGWEWIADHGRCFELVFIFDDSGYAIVLLVPNEPSIDADLIALCKAYTPADA